jgi:pimeloyl-ACP methyl ester carboxylesterase
MDLQYSSTDTFSKTILRPRAVYAVDLRGRGNSDGERFYVEKFDDYVSDVEAVVAVTWERKKYNQLCCLASHIAQEKACQ